MVFLEKKTSKWKRGGGKEQKGTDVLSFISPPHESQIRGVNYKIPLQFEVVRIPCPSAKLSESHAHQLYFTEIHSVRQIFGHCRIHSWVENFTVNHGVASISDQLIRIKVRNIRDQKTYSLFELMSSFIF